MYVHTFLYTYIHIHMCVYACVDISKERQADIDKERASQRGSERERGPNNSLPDLEVICLRYQMLYLYQEC